MKRLFIFVGFIFVLLVTAFHLPSLSYAQTSSLLPAVNSGVPQDQNTFIQSALLHTSGFFYCQLIGYNPSLPSSKCLGFDQSTKKIGYVENNGGVLGFITNGIASTYAIDIHLHDYTSHLAQNFGFSHAYAATTGAQQLSPFFQAWQNMRNITYVFFVVAFVIIGISIMLRVKIDPRTVISIQSQLPRAIIALLLISFSYGISGFLVDMMYVATYSTFPLMANSGLINADNLKGLQTSQDHMTVDSPIQFFSNITSIPGLAFNSLVNAGEILGSFILPDSSNTSIISLITGGIGALVALIIGALILVFAAPGAVFFPIVLIAILVWSLLKVWFNLLKSFIVVIVDTIIAPIWIFLGVLPGSKVTFETWFRHLSGYLAVFPATVLFFLVTKGLMDTLGRAGGSFSLPLIGAGHGANTMGSLVGFAMVMLAPKLQEWILAIFKAPSGGTIAAAIMGNFNEGRSRYDKNLIQPIKTGITKPLPSRIFSRNTPIEKYYERGALIPGTQRIDPTSGLPIPGTGQYQVVERSRPAPEGVATRGFTIPRRVPLVGGRNVGGRSIENWLEDRETTGGRIGRNAARVSRSTLKRLTQGLKS